MAPIADFLASVIPWSLPPHLQSYVPGKTPLSTPPAGLPDARRIPRGRVQPAGVHEEQAANEASGPLPGAQHYPQRGQLAPAHLHGGGDRPAFLEARSVLVNRLELFYIINYYFKYLELLDTIFLALKKKPLAFLHVYHHSATALLCFTQLNGKTSVQWIPITINLSVHVLMYYYYYATAGGAKIWWKKHLTTMQIVQFVIDLVAVYFATYSYYAASYFPNLPSFGSCAGTESAAVFGCAILSSYLGLFVQFYINTYKKPVRGKAPIANGKPIANGNGVANGHGHKLE
ncbi:hypothetical protein EVJ58_g10711 [Rhodofomes roseus]|uniref:Elongation of fatty acids protein n=1 Tax=Rhodofomes roseus TaxID=34475 RepID=A0A4Y9XRJ5_9APHY|nr:hypothetical protein EVJ58_g10711 [Rhodofomes roseus]